MARKDGNERRAFRKETQDAIEDGHSPSFESLTDGEGGWHSQKMAWRDQDGNLHEYGQPGFHSNEGVEPGWFDTNWDASHSVSHDPEKPNHYAIEGSSQNRRDGALERQGQVLEKPAVEIEGLVVNKAHAEKMEAKGLLTEGTVENSPEVVGWNRQNGVVSRESPSHETNSVRTPEIKASSVPQHERDSQQSQSPEKAMFENKKKKQGQAGPSPQTTGSFGGQGGENGDDLSKAKFGKGLEKYRHEYLARQKSQSLSKK